MKYAAEAIVTYALGSDIMGWKIEFFTPFFFNCEIYIMLFALCCLFVFHFLIALGVPTLEFVTVSCDADNKYRSNDFKVDIQLCAN